MRLSIVQGAFFPVPPVRGGAVEKVWFDLGKRLAGRGHKVTHVSRAFRDLPRREILEGVQHLRVTGAEAPHNPLLYKLQDLRYSLRARRALPDADVVVTNTFWLPILGVPRRAGRLYVHVARYPRGQMRWYGKAARLQAISHAVARAVTREAPRLASRVVTLPYPAAVSNGLMHDLDAGLKTVLYVGRVHEEKGLLLLADAFSRIHAEMSDVRLKIVGPWQVQEGGGGERYLAELKRRLAVCGDAAVVEEPEYDPQKLADIYRGAGIFVYPSLAGQGEAFGLAVLEAMCAGCHPVVSDLECFEDVVGRDGAGTVFDHRGEGAANRLAKVLRQLLGQPDGLRSKRELSLRHAARFAPEHVADMYEADLLRVAGMTP